MGRTYKEWEDEAFKDLEYYRKRREAQALWYKNKWATDPEYRARQKAKNKEWQRKKRQELKEANAPKPVQPKN
jgi:beta-phosphoglucomutase-like phosphatase (HAD superfamily)